MKVATNKSSKTPRTPFKTDMIYLVNVSMAQKFIKANQWEDAGNAYLQAAILAENNLKEFDKASNCYLESANCYRATLSEKAYQCFRKTIDVYIKRVDNHLI
ncbi:hypothetical protein RF11_02934 [Thelohanellus kitauei]|uniref:Alpha-soluble NSF attachment protein n=1 Tax=Thelohanellus kitauei TaxID=669202 RepID=A0A0C2J549_THEKT|nr:hypothetical protein RF11_02934 [Thelohanellus kitauei]